MDSVIIPSLDGRFSSPICSPSGRLFRGWYIFKDSVGETVNHHGLRMIDSQNYINSITAEAAVLRLKTNIHGAVMTLFVNCWYLALAIFRRCSFNPTTISALFPIFSQPKPQLVKTDSMQVYTHIGILTILISITRIPSGHWNFPWALLPRIIISIFWVFCS